MDVNDELLLFTKIAADNVALKSGSMSLGALEIDLFEDGF